MVLITPPPSGDTNGDRFNSPVHNPLFLLPACSLHSLLLADLTELFREKGLETGDMDALVAEYYEWKLKNGGV